MSGRGMQSNILARYLHVGPARLHFSHGQFGKSALASDYGADHLSYNLYYSD